jgi:hypothetical protein
VTRARGVACVTLGGRPLGSFVGLEDVALIADEFLHVSEGFPGGLCRPMRVP